MSISEQTCNCGPSTSADAGSQGATAPCTCGCCGPAPAPTEQQIADLLRQRDQIDQRLADLRSH
jgi:hypothetical protein